MSEAFLSLDKLVALSHPFVCMMKMSWLECISLHFADRRRFSPPVVPIDIQFERTARHIHQHLFILPFLFLKDRRLVKQRRWERKCLRQWTFPFFVYLSRKNLIIRNVKEECEKNLLTIINYSLCLSVSVIQALMVEANGHPLSYQSFCYRIHLVDLSVRFPS